MSAPRAIPVLLVMALASPAAAGAQPAVNAAPSPPGGVAEVERSFGLGLGVARLGWDAAAPYDDATMVTLSIERDLWTGVRGRAGLGWGGSALAAGTPVDAGVWSIDLQVVLAPAFGRFAGLPVLPYVVGGFGSLVTNPRSEGDVDLPTRSQSQWTYGGGVRGGFAERWEAAVEATAAGVRFADPTTPENRETRTIHNVRWEARLQWRF